MFQLCHEEIPGGRDPNDACSSITTGKVARALGLDLSEAA